MILLDTNHVSILRMPPSERRTRLVERMTLAQNEVFGIPIVAVEETMRGWLAAIAKERLVQPQVDRAAVFLDDPWGKAIAAKAVWRVGRVGEQPAWQEAVAPSAVRHKLLTRSTLHQ